MPFPSGALPRTGHDSEIRSLRRLERPGRRPALIRTCGSPTVCCDGGVIVRYDEVVRPSLQEPEAFWSDDAPSLRSRTQCYRVLDRKDPKPLNWFQGGEL